MAVWCFPGDEGRYLSVLHPFLSLMETEWLEDNVLGFQALPENTGNPLSCFPDHSWINILLLVLP